MENLPIAAFCPWPYAPGRGAPFGIPHDHVYHHPLSYRMRAPRWAFDEGPCCEFCDALNNIPSLGAGFEVLGEFSPFEVADIMNAFNGIHYHYRLGLDRDGPDSYHLSREVQKLSKHLQWMYYMHPWVPQLAMLANQLKHMGKEIQVGRRRLRYHTMPKQRFNPRNLLMQW